ncbi:MAG: LysR family transcriptional regulator [Burkholderiaceae bacterium]
MQVKSHALLGQLADMDLRLLRVFKAVVDCGGMAAAELELNIGVSTISRHVKDLEVRLAMTLCRRGRGGFSLTAEGEQIYAETLRLLASTEAFRASVDAIHRHLGGQLHVAVFDKTATNPAARIGAAIALFCEQAPDVALNLHVAAINAIERGVIDGQFQVGVIPGHRRSESLAYDTLFDETMLLYCGVGHTLFEADDAAMDWNVLASHRFAGLGYHSPNMEISQQMRLARQATAFDQEAIATLILSGRFLGFLPDHYAAGFVGQRQMRALRPELFRYSCQFLAIVRRSPEPSRAARVFQACLLHAHGGKEMEPFASDSYG